MRLWYWLGGALAALVLLAGTAAAAIPGPQRAICPQCFGLTAISANVFTDGAEQAEALNHMAAQANAATESFFGSLRSNPRIILCTTAACQRDFDIPTIGVTNNAVLIRIAPDGLRQTILTHERLHAELTARLGFAGIVGEPVPIWFNEGLATYLSGDDRFDQPYSADDIARIKTAVSRDAWNQRLAERDWIAGYGAARAAIAELDASIGQEGLRRIVEGIAAGQDYDTARAGIR